MPKILVVDDERVMVKGIKFNLENEGYQVDTGCDGEEAVDKARTGQFDLIILDLMMPKIDGLQACMNILELKARIRALLRRAGAAAQQQREADRLTQGPIALDLRERAAWRDGEQVDLTAKEFDLMALLMQNPGRVYSRENLLNLVWGYEYVGEFRTVDVHIRRLREKLEPDPANPEHILTKWGVGYYLANSATIGT